MHLIPEPAEEPSRKIARVAKNERPIRKKVERRSSIVEGSNSGSGHGKNDGLAPDRKVTQDIEVGEDEAGR